MGHSMIDLGHSMIGTDGSQKALKDYFKAHSFL